MQTSTLRSQNNGNGLIPAGAIFERLARDLREANARKLAATAKVARACRSRDNVDVTH